MADWLAGGPALTNIWKGSSGCVGVKFDLSWEFRQRKKYNHMPQSFDNCGAVQSKSQHLNLFVDTHASQVMQMTSRFAMAVVDQRCIVLSKYRVHWIS